MIFDFIMIAKNNPFNIRYNVANNWLGQTGQHKGFCDFDTMEHGLRAAIVLLKNYVYRKDLQTVAKVVSRFAPSNENDTSAYIRFVSDGLRSAGHNPDDLRTSFILEYDMTFFYLLKYMAKMETGYSFTYLDYSLIVRKYGLKKELYGHVVDK